MGQLEGVGEQLPCSVVADPEGGSKVGGCELRDPRRTGAGERGQSLAVQVGLAPVGRSPLGRAGVQLCPDQRELELLDRGLLLGLPGCTGTLDHPGGGERRCGVHGENSRLYH